MTKKSKKSTRDLISYEYKKFVKSKRSQHEIVGFILIVVIVVIIGLFLLVFYLRREPVRYESIGVQNFLQSSMLYTSNCSLSIEPLDMQDLIKSCYRNDRCLNNKMACDVLRESLSELVRESWLVSAEKPVKAYFFDVYYDEKQTEKGKEFMKGEILSLKEGNCTGSKAGAEHFLHYGKGNIIVSMEICYV